MPLRRIRDADGPALLMKTSLGWDGRVIREGTALAALTELQIPFTRWLSYDPDDIEHAPPLTPAPRWLTLGRDDEPNRLHRGQVRVSWRVLDPDAWATRNDLSSALFSPHPDALLHSDPLVCSGPARQPQRTDEDAAARLFTTVVEDYVRRAALRLRSPRLDHLEAHKTVICAQESTRAVLVQARREAQS